MDDIARLIAIEEIRQLKARYFRLMDLRDFNGMGAVFAQDALFDATDAPRIQALDGAWHGDPGPIVRGRDAIIAWVAQAFAGRCSVHHGHGHEITIDSATTAHGVIAMEDKIFTPDRRTLLIHGMGHYTERYIHEDGAWRIAETRLTRLARITPSNAA